MMNNRVNTDLYGTVKSSKGIQHRGILLSKYHLTFMFVLMIGFICSNVISTLLGHIWLTEKIHTDSSMMPNVHSRYLLQFDTRSQNNKNKNDNNNKNNNKNIENKNAETTKSSTTDTNKDGTVVSNSSINEDILNEGGVVVASRSFNLWPVDEYPLPCTEPGPNEESDDMRLKVKDKGFLFVKPMKVGGSTANGIQLRIAERVAEIQNKTFHRCQASYGHNYGIYFQNRIIGRSFLWTMLRHPQKRIVSQFFHFYVSRQKVEPTDMNFQNALIPGNVNGINAKDYYINVHRFVSQEESQTLHYDPVLAANQIIQNYDFIGITERFDESIVVLQILLGLETSDVMYLTAKGNGGFDDGEYNGGCHFIVPSFVSPGMETYFDSEEFQQQIRWDMALYEAANRSLDMTIDTVIGRQVFTKALDKFRMAQRIVQDICLPEARFPCTSGGTRQYTNCLHHDEGCGDSCITRVMNELKLE